MASAVKHPHESAHEKLILWRYEHLVDLGFAPQDAVQLVEIPDVVSGATDLILAGCPVEIALDLLKP